METHGILSFPTRPRHRCLPFPADWSKVVETMINTFIVLFLLPHPFPHLHPHPPPSPLLCFVLFSAFFRALPSSAFIRVCYFCCFPSLFVCSALSVCSVAVVVAVSKNRCISLFLPSSSSFLLSLLEISFVASVLHQWSLGTLSVLACHVRITASNS